MLEAASDGSCSLDFDFDFVFAFDNV